MHQNVAKFTTSVVVFWFCHEAGVHAKKERKKKEKWHQDGAAL